MDETADPAAELAAVRAIFRQAPHVAEMGIEPIAIERGRCETELVIEDAHLQHTGRVHAGVLTTLADHTAGAAAQSLIDAPRCFAITAELKMSLLRAAQGERLVCIGTVIKPGRAFMFTEAEVYCEHAGERQLVAKLSATMAVVAVPE